MTDREKFEEWFADVQKPAMIKVGIKLAEQNLCHDVALMAWQAALASQQPADDVWIEWEGGDQPVDDYAVVEVRFRNGSVEAGEFAECYEWNHGYHDLSTTSVDIIAYRVVKP